MPRDAYESIYEIAVDQYGLFSAAQARSAGVEPMAVVMMERRRVIERLSRGVYRLSHFPYSPLAQYVEAALWPSGTIGIISHESALALYGVSDVSPSRTHITVPARFRTRRSLPPTIALHQADLPEVDVTEHEGVRVTTPTRTLRDCRRSHLGAEIIGQALTGFAANGYLSGPDLDALQAELHSS